MEPMERKETTFEITLADIWDVFAHHFIPIILAALLSAAAYFAYDSYTRIPLYNSKASMYVLNQKNIKEYETTSADFSFANTVLGDCTYIIKSHAVLDAVIDELQLDMSYGALANSITVNNPEGTCVLEVTVKTEDAELSKMVVDSVCHISADKIAHTLGILDQVSVYTEGIVDHTVANTVPISRFALVGILAALVVYAIFFLIYILDDKIKSEEDIEHYLGLSVLGDIPNGHGDNHKKGKYNGYYYSKYAYKKYAYKKYADDTDRSKKGDEAK